VHAKGTFFTPCWSRHLLACDPHQAIALCVQCACVSLKKEYVPGRHFAEDEITGLARQAASEAICGSLLA
jgi:hypothetical protein